MPKIIEGEDLALELVRRANREVNVTTEGILEGFRDINQTQEMKDFYDSVIPSANVNQGG